ncbi:hypothetical protein DFH08DRAFT_812396 [Mycena albidolilacea]|uniref:Uncharacterized protein n=1 Tax=Mycena albidolilacea TaxID=1033008 RepID=A0AAD6ZUJ4_9AGAR|nr:hypothetical protein DFH08DRAFT_812396 [Mycena albidolilacea]
MIDFIATLIHAVLQQADLRALGETLDSLHFYQINEIVSVTVDDVGTEQFGLRCNFRVVRLADPAKFLSVAMDVMFDPREALLNWVKVWQLWREVEELDTSESMTGRDTIIFNYMTQC